MFSFQKIIAWALIGLLSFEAIFRVPLIIAPADALAAKDHEDIVSILVEEELFREISSDIDTYARRIQSVLPHTRTAILTYARDTHPYLIASANERIYYSGLPNHARKTQKLVGTILIGHVPLPVVHKNGRDFLSLFPYTDFLEPHFFWNWETSRYEYLNTSRADTRPEVWHSVIDPNSGNMDTDVEKIREFFARVYEYDAKKWRYQDVGADPQVLYMDTINESRSASKGGLAVYEKLSQPNQEHFLYHRYSGDFARYIYDNYLALMKSEGSSAVLPFSGWKPATDSPSTFLAKASDISTKMISTELLTPFLTVINEKFLGDIQRWVHNAGRYYNGYSDVRMDSLPELITTKDELAGQIIKESNDVLEKMIDTYVDNNLSIDIPILVSRPTQKTVTESQVISGKRTSVSRTYSFVYDNYFYGTKASEITTAESCSLNRWSTFGARPTTVETNHGYNVIAGPEDVKILAADGQAKIICKNNTLSYWWGNSPLNTAVSNEQITLKTHRYDDFSLPVLDLGAGKRTASTNSPLDCLRNDLLLHPYQHTGINNQQYNWPQETGWTRYSCTTALQSPTPAPISLDPTPETSENILTSLVACTGTGTITLLDRNGGSLGLCQANGLSGTYKRIPSLIKHSDPNTLIYGKQLVAKTTPNLPIDEERYLLYLDRKASVARINYPNLFDINVDFYDTDEVIVSKIQAALQTAQSSLLPAVSPDNRWSKLINSGNSPASLAETLLADNDLRAGLIDALRWKNLNIEMKYAHALDTSLSTSKTADSLLIPDKKKLYEIAYMGGEGDPQNFVFWFSPEGKTALPGWFTDIQKKQKEIVPMQVTSDTDPEFTLSSSEVAALLGESSGETWGEEGGEEWWSEEEIPEAEIADSECGDPNGVVIWEWLEAIQCWLSNLLDTEWFTPEIEDLEFPEMPSLTISFGEIVWSTKELKDVEIRDENDNDVTDYVESHKSDLVLHNTLGSTTLEPNHTVRIDTALEDSTYLIDDDMSTVRIEITRIDDLDEKASYSARDADWENIKNKYVTISGSATMKDWHGVWSFSSKNSHRARVIFETQIYDKNGEIIRSERSSILIWPLDFTVTARGTPETNIASIIAGNKDGLYFITSGLPDETRSVTITLKNYVTGATEGVYTDVPLTDGIAHLGSPTIDPVIRRAGRYTATLSTNQNIGKTHFNITPDAAHHLTAVLNPILIRDTTEMMQLALQDIWWNTIDAQDWDMAIQSNVDVGISPVSSGSARTFSGRMNPTLTLTPRGSGVMNLDFTLTHGDQVIRSTVTRPVLDHANVSIDLPKSDLIVWQKVPVTVSIKREDGTILDSWNTPLRIAVQGAGAGLTHTMLQFEKWVATTILNTGTQTGTIRLYLPDAFSGKSIVETRKILPWPSAKLEIGGPKVIHAKPQARDTITLMVYDQFGNLTDSDGVPLIVSESPKLHANLGNLTHVRTGVYTIDIVSSGIAGRVLLRGYIKKDDAKPTIENVYSVQALPVITSTEAGENSWNNITQVLLGAAFGQTPMQDYFWGATLFSPDTKTLSLSTLVDSPEISIFTISPEGNIKTGTIQYGTGIEGKIEWYEDGRLIVQIYDTRLGPLARVRYPTLADTAFEPCVAVSSCHRDFVNFSPWEGTITVRDAFVYAGARQLFPLKDIFNIPEASFALLHQTWPTLNFSVSLKGEFIWNVTLGFTPRVPTESPDGNSISFESLRSSLSHKLIWNNFSSHETPGMIIYDSSTKSPYLGGAHASGWSAYPAKNGLGWTHDNTSLLQFASWQEWAWSMRDNGDYLTINLGDPVVSLPAYSVNPATGFDQTMGVPVYMWDSSIDDFTFRDTNSDGKKDLIVYQEDWTVGMTLATGNGIALDVGDLLSVENAASGMVRAGDFIGDGFADIVYVDSEWVLHLVTHDAWGPEEKPMKYNENPILWGIEQIEVFDMDHDGIDDIIVLDHLGSLFIFYGQKSGIFVVQLIENVYDFVFSDTAKSAYFTGAIAYRWPWYVDPDTLPEISTLEGKTRQQQIRATLYTQTFLPTTSPTIAVKPDSLGTVMKSNLDVDQWWFLRMYDGDSAARATALQTGYDALAVQWGDSIKLVTGNDPKTSAIDLLKAPFIQPKNILITKQYISLEESGQVISWSPIEVQLNITNTSSQPISGITLLERFADYIEVKDGTYDLVRGDTTEQRKFYKDSAHANAGIADLRDVTLAPQSSLKIIYLSTLRSFSFGSFDVGYLEDKNDPTSALSLPLEKIRTINPEAQKLTAIPENDFYNHDVYGDIRFNPNETCWGPLLLWRSHNTFDRTYHKVVLDREVADPDANASQLGQNPSDALNPDPVTSSWVSPAASPESGAEWPTLTEAESEVVEWNTDTDADSIPDASDDDHGEVLEITTEGNTTKISVTLWKIDKVVDEIMAGVKDILSGLSCGFGDPGCISMPINWAANMPGNTITAMGYAIPKANQPPIACFNDVRCGYPVFSYPTDCCRSFSTVDLALCASLKASGSSTNVCTWPSAWGWAGGWFDYSGGGTNTQTGNGLEDIPSESGVSTGKKASTFIPGEWISKFRIFVGATLTWAVAEVMCFGPNTQANPTINVPWLFPIKFEWNCIFATQPLTQCEDDGKDDSVLETELDVETELDDEGEDDGDGNGGWNRFTNADECSFFDPLEAYPADLSDATSNYLAKPTDTTAGALQSSIAANADLINDTGWSDAALTMETALTESAYDRLNGSNRLEYELNDGSGMLQIALDPSAMKFRGFGKVIDINLLSIRWFPNFLMDWYQRQMDEIMSSLTHLPDLKIFLPDLTGLADGWYIWSFGKGLKQKLGDIVNPEDAQNAPQNQDPNAAQPYTGEQMNLTSEQVNSALNSCGAWPRQCVGGVRQYLSNIGDESWATHPMNYIEEKYSLINDHSSNNVQVWSVAVFKKDQFSPKYAPYGDVAVVIADLGNYVKLYQWNNIPGKSNLYSGAGGGTGPSTGTYLKSQIEWYYHPSKSWSSWTKSTTSSSGSTSSSSTTSSASSWTTSISSHSAGWNIATTAGQSSPSSGFQWALDKFASGVDRATGAIDSARDAVVSGVQQKTAGIQNAFEYLWTLPIIDVHPETIRFDIPWVGKQESQAWLQRNEAILQAWQNLPADALHSIDVWPIISSIEQNIEIVKTYFELPERLQTLFYLKEKLLYGILQNVHAIQQLMGGWLYENGLRFRAWVETFILVTKLWDLWQVLIDVFNDYEVNCGICRNERWNLQHWLWIVISLIIPPIPIIEMPRWPDIELDFSDIDLSLDIAYPVFDLSFYPVHLPDAPTPTLTGFAVNPMPLFPELPDFDIDFEVPVVELPKLPDLPPPPKIPELSQAIEIVLDIFKLITFIQCLYRKVPLSPEWFVGTKVAHKTERQWYLPFDFLDFRLPNVYIEWIEAIRVSTHVKLKYDVDFIVDMLREALEPFTDFPKNFHRLWENSSTPSTVNIDINPDGVDVETSTTQDPPLQLAQLPDMIRELFVATTEAPLVDTVEGNNLLDALSERLWSRWLGNQLAVLTSAPLGNVEKSFHDRFDTITQAINLDLAENKDILWQLNAWDTWNNKPENIPIIAQNLVGSPQLASNTPVLGNHLLALNPSVINPSLVSLTAVLPRPTQILESVAPVLSVSPEPAIVPTPGTGNTFDTTSLQKTRGIYVTHGGSTNRLTDYTENLDGDSKIHEQDDDGDGDLDVFYSMDNAIYRKENFQKNPAHYYITDAPKVYSQDDIFEDFFDMSSRGLRDIPGDSQISILVNHEPEKIPYTFLIRDSRKHMQLNLYPSRFESDLAGAVYRVDILPEIVASDVSPITGVPRISDIDGQVFIDHTSLYRRLITGKKYIDEEGKIQNLSDDFVIREWQSGYARETTVIEVANASFSKRFTLRAGQRFTFSSDSHVTIRKWEFLLFGTTSERRPLTIRDTGLPLLPGDTLISEKNGGATIIFPDGNKTQVYDNQTWTLAHYTPGVGIKRSSLPVEADWYYGSIIDAGSPSDARTPYGDVFDAYSSLDLSDAISHIPRQITLILPSPSEIDFQTYFPYDTLTNVEIFQLPSSQWRRISNTKIAFESQKTSKEILVRVTTESGRVRDYTTNIVSVAPKLGIQKIDQTGLVTGTISAANELPMGIQSSLDGQSWTLANGFTSNPNNTFTTNISRSWAKLVVNLWPTALATFDRSSSTPVLSAGMSLVPNVILGKTLGYSLQEGTKERLRVTYQSQNLSYRQIAAQNEITGAGIFILWSGLRLEPATITDTMLKWGVYITDSSYQPIVTLDSSGIIRTLNTNVSWSVANENNRVVFTLARAWKELGKIILSGDVITTWSGQ